MLVSMGIQNDITLRKMFWKFIWKYTHTRPSYTEIPHPSIYPRKLKYMSSKILYKDIHSIFTLISKTENSLSIEFHKYTWYTNMIPYYSVIKWNKSLIHVASRINLKNIILHGRSFTLKNRILFIWQFATAKIIYTAQNKSSICFRVVWEWEWLASLTKHWGEVNAYKLIRVWIAEVYVCIKTQWMYA